MDPNLFIFLAVVLIFYYFADTIIRKKLDVGKIGGLSYILIIALIILLFIVLISNNLNLQPHYFLGAIILVYIFRSFMELKYKAAEKQYMRSFLSVGVLFIVFIGVELYFF